MIFSIFALDHTDAEAPDRRIAHRDMHLSRLKDLHTRGQFIGGGALLSDGGKMVGSNVLVSFESRRALDEWLASEPYLSAKVWDDVRVTEIRAFRLVS